MVSLSFKNRKKAEKMKMYTAKPLAMVIAAEDGGVGNGYDRCAKGRRLQVHNRRSSQGFAFTGVDGMTAYRYCPSVDDR